MVTSRHAQFHITDDGHLILTTEYLRKQGQWIDKI